MNKSIFIVGGGSSLEGFDFSRLKNENTIAVNSTALDVPSPTYCITADSGIFRKVQEGFFKTVKTTWVLVTNPDHCSMQQRNGRFVHVKSGFIYDLFCVNMVIRNAGVEGIGFSFADFRTGYNSGFCALQLAFLLGYELIYLLGIDMQGRHYRGRCERKKIKDEAFEKFYDNFVTALNILERETDVRVVSCSGTSRLNNIIPYVPFEEILR